MRILLTGVAGFIGYHTALMLVARGHYVCGFDNLNDYYDPSLKQARLDQLLSSTNFSFIQGDLAEEGALVSAFGKQKFDVIIHLAAQAGVRYSDENPRAYTQSNLVGHHNVLEYARSQSTLPHLVYASSSSVYGNSTPAPFRETACADKPVSFYGATKRAGELLSHSYAELYGLKQTALRFFTVYGPWGRPDMAYWMFTDAILRGRPLKIFGNGLLKRDFTFINDIAPAVVRIAETRFAGEGRNAPHRIYNLGNNHPETVIGLVRAIETASGLKAEMVDAEGPPGDVNETYADITSARQDFGFVPRISLEEGISRFVQWFKAYHRIT